MIYIVEYFDSEEPDPRWCDVPLGMCRPGRLCERCKKDITHMDVCDNMFKDTEDKQVAEDKLKQLQEDGFQARIIKK